MAEILNFIRKYETGGIDVFLEDTSAWPDIEQSRQFLLTIDKEERTRIYTALQNIMKALADQQNSLMTQQKSLQVKMQSDIKTRTACITYLEHARDVQKQMKNQRRS